MRDFDSELSEDRAFKIGGQVFYWKYPHWRVGAKLFDDEAEELKQLASENGDAIEFSFVADTETAIKKIPEFLEDENDMKKRWTTLVNRKTDPVPRHQIVELYKWLVRVVSGFPTTPPSDSSSTAGNSGTSSVAAGSSTAQTPTA